MKTVLAVHCLLRKNVLVWFSAKQTDLFLDVSLHVTKTEFGGVVSVCLTSVVDSVQAAQALRGCTVIEGYLEIQIRGGSKAQFVFKLIS